MKYIILLLALVAHPAFANDVDIRYCGVAGRDPDGSIHRDMVEVAKFKRIHPCPSNGNRAGACPGWAIDHVISLAVGGCDKVFNMQWLPDQIKSCSDPACKDRWERKIYRPGGAIVQLPGSYSTSLTSGAQQPPARDTGR
jgi:hypothetical protein